MTNKIYLKTFNEYAIMKAAKADPDAQPLTFVELAKFKPVNPHLPKLTTQQLKDRGLL